MRPLRRCILATTDTGHGLDAIVHSGALPVARARAELQLLYSPERLSVPTRA